MGLDTTHGCWHGPYSSFTRWRTAVTKAAGWPMQKAPNDVYEYAANIDWDQITEDNLEGHWDNEPEDPLVVLIAHSDCDGVIWPEHAGPLADRLEGLLDKLSDEDRGHTEQFISGLRYAASRREQVQFH